MKPKLKKKHVPCIQELMEETDMEFDTAFSRCDLEEGGDKPAPFVAFGAFTSEWQKRFKDVPSPAILREFWDDYLTSIKKNLQEYFDGIEE